MMSLVTLFVGIVTVLELIARRKEQKSKHGRSG
jgi:hypothetical protein